MSEKTEIRRFGVLLDCSRNTVLKVDTVKKWIDMLQKIGYNALELYTEDTLEIEGEPYLGYLRGRYSCAEIREIDAYASAHGIELIPCIQTLWHYTNPCKLPRFSEIIDIDDILLIDEQKTYEFIDRIFASLEKNFTSRNVYIGMDEAHKVGLGKYLDRYGCCDRIEIVTRHLAQVVDIARKYGFSVHMCSDMYFRLAANGEYYKPAVSVPKFILKEVPKNVSLVYWDYYHTEKEHYDAMIAAHEQFERELWFMGGAWTWLGFAPRTRFAYSALKPAMQSVCEKGIQNILITLWGDDGAECSFFSVLQILYAARRYADGECDDEAIANEFEKLFGLSAHDWDLLELPDILPDLTESKLCNASKYLLYSDPFLGVADEIASRYKRFPYADYVERLTVAKSRAGEYDYIFDVAQKLCRLLEIKANLGVRTRDAYRNKDVRAIKTLIVDYEQAACRAREFSESFSTRWHKENKPFGYEVHCVRLGGLIERIEYCKKRLQEYAEGAEQEIEELEVDILPYYTDPNGDELWMSRYKNIVSTSEL